MTEFKFNVGDKVKLNGWNNGSWIEILMIGKKCFFGNKCFSGKDQDSSEGAWAKNNNWQLYEPAQESLIGRTFEFETKFMGKSNPTIKFIKEVK